MNALTITDLHASVGTTPILRGVNLELPFGEVHALMGPNGSGKSTLSHVLTGKREYKAAGSVLLDGEEILGLDVDERARRGLLQGFQYPVEVPGVGLEEFMQEVGAAKGIDADEMASRIEEESRRFGMDGFLGRSVNDDLSGGEKKRSEMFQVSILDPKAIILDEIDSGLDIDAVRSVSEAVEQLRSPDVGILLITHYSRILRYLNTDRVHVMMNGAIVDSGGAELADELETGGYEALRTRLGIETPKVAAGVSAPDPFAVLPFEDA